MKKCTPLHTICTPVNSLYHSVLQSLCRCADFFAKMLWIYPEVNYSRDFGILRILLWDYLYFPFSRISKLIILGILGFRGFYCGLIYIFKGFWDLPVQSDLQSDEQNFRILIRLHRSPPLFQHYKCKYSMRSDCKSARTEIKYFCQIWVK